MQDLLVSDLFLYPPAWIQPRGRTRSDPGLFSAPTGSLIQFQGKRRFFSYHILLLELFSKGAEGVEQTAPGFPFALLRLAARKLRRGWIERRDPAMQ